MRWFARTEQLIGEEARQRLAQARVAIYGLGGVGSFACETLARAGVGHLRLVDHDVVNASNLNRQLLALRSTLGQPKVEVARARVLDINPECQVDARRAFLNNDTVAELLEGPLDLVIDAIDSVNAKTALLQRAVELGLPVVASMGAGGRLDAGQIETADLFDTHHCPLAAIIRKRLRHRGVGEPGRIRAVFSAEPCQNERTPHPLDVEGQAPDGPGRPRTPLGTVPYLPAAFGLRVAQEAMGMLMKG
ncbi:MAG: tRNA threonylcarbamoyladenosine dehydratase [Firmicutes bacterium]|nr:tRNA threonylcarbamoyladenosine dehydratase [Bacillota bacterium]